jgi:hypothetical protein
MTPTPAPDRIYGTTYPRDRAPEGAVPLGPERPSTFRERVARVLAGVSLRVLHVRPGDVIVVRGERPTGARVAALMRAINRGRDDDPAIVFLPRDCSVHVEGRQIDAEDRGGYRETSTYQADKSANEDKGKGPLPPRGVYTGVADGRDPPSDTTPRA